MWQEKMTQEEEDLEEELSSLDIREDLGDEDSDVTPINTPPSTPPILYIKKYPPARPEHDGKQNFQRFAKAEDYDCRSESSMSWGDDEFEGEATKQVSILFDQVDVLLYREKQSTSALNSPEVISPSASTVDSPFHSENLCASSDDSPDIDLGNNAHNTHDFDRKNSSARKLAYGFSIEESYSENIQSENRIFDYGKFHEASVTFSDEHMVVSDPTPELQEECYSWGQQFPHFRARGFSVDPLELEEREESLSSDYMLQEDTEEEVVACDGDFNHLLPLVVYTSANQVQVKSSSKENSKRVTPSSRVCSGSNDPEVLKEQVMFLLFEKLWETVTKTVEPLLFQYARYIIEQSVQYMSISREPSTRGSRISGQRIPQKKISDDLRTNNKFLMPTNVVHRPFSGGTGNLLYRANRPTTGIRRPSSAVHRLQNSLTIPDIQQEELHELLQVSAKPLQNGEDRMRSYPSSTTQTRESSALSRLSHVSLPVMTTPRDNIQRPISSKSTSRHLTPVKTKNSTSSLEQRPASTSSFNSRMRFQEKFQHLNRQCTIQELGTDNAISEMDDGIQEQASPVWSRHIPFLPPITDNAVIPLKVPQFSAVTREDKTQPMLCVKGTVMSATHRLDAHPRSGKSSWVSGRQPVEPFLSWVVEKVDNNRMQILGQDKHLVVKNSLVKEDSKNICMFRTKHFRRYSHH